jgi:hypothetical protein
MEAFDIEEPPQDQSLFDKYKYFIIGGVVVVIIVVVSVLLWYFLRKKDEPQSKPPQVDPKINLLTVLTTDDTDYYTDLRVKKEYTKFYNLVKTILGNNIPKVCYNLDKIRLKPETLNKERNVDILVRAAVDNALIRKNYFDIAALYLQMMRTNSPEYDNWFITVEKEPNGLTPRMVRIPKDGSLVNPTPFQLIQKYATLYLNNENDLNIEPLKSSFNLIKNSPNYNSNIISIDDLANLLTVLMLMKLKNTVNYISYPPCDV